MMRRAKKSGRLLHTRRPVATRRPLHLTMRVRDDVPGLRRDEVFAIFRDLVAAARVRGVRTVAFAVLSNHVHWFLTTTSPEALRDATRYVFGQLARRLNALFARRGKVFAERYWSSVCTTARQAFATLGYVLKNAVTAGYRLPRTGLDRFTTVDDDTLAADPFLRSVVGPTPGARRVLLERMARGPVPFVRISERLQPALPGL